MTIGENTGSRAGERTWTTPRVQSLEIRETADNTNLTPPEAFPTPTLATS